MANRKSLDSLPTIIRTTEFEQEKLYVQSNEQHFEHFLAVLAPDLYRIWNTLQVYSINGEVLPSIIKALGDICHSTMRGKVIIEIEPNNKRQPVIKKIKALDVNEVNVTAWK